MENFNHLNLRNENDLDFYEKYFSEKIDVNEGVKQLAEIKHEQNFKNKYEIEKPLCNLTFSREYLQKNIGKLIKTESLICYTLDCKIGILIEVGADYIVIKLSKSCCSLMIPTATIKYITIIHDNDFKKTAT